MNIIFIHTYSHIHSSYSYHIHIYINYIYEKNAMNKKIHMYV